MTTPKIITSLTNDRVKAIRALEMRKVRKETGLFVAEGASLLVTARDNGFVPETLVYQAGTAASGITRGLVTHALEFGRRGSRSFRSRARQARLERQSADASRRLPAAVR